MTTHQPATDNHVRRSKRLSSDGADLAREVVEHRQALGDLCLNQARGGAAQGRKLRKTADAEDISGNDGAKQASRRHRPSRGCNRRDSAIGGVPPVVPKQVVQVVREQAPIPIVPELPVMVHLDDLKQGIDEDQQPVSPHHPPAWFTGLPDHVRSELHRLLSDPDLTRDSDFVIRDTCSKLQLPDSQVDDLLRWIVSQEKLEGQSPAKPDFGGVMFAGQTEPAFLYANEIYENQLGREHRFLPKTDYMETTQEDITHHMRSILVDWLVEVGEEYKLSSQTLFLTINYIDRLLGTVPIHRNELQLLGITSMLVAAKYEEIYPPTIADFVYISDNTYTRAQVLGMESTLLNALMFNLSAPTPYEFIRRYCCAANIGERPQFLAHFLSELLLMQPTYLKHKSSVIAAGTISLALHTLHMGPWSPGLYRATGYTADALVECIFDVHQAHKKAVTETQTLKAIRDKYREPKWGQVASIPLRRWAVGAMVETSIS